MTTPLQCTLPNDEQYRSIALIFVRAAAEQCGFNGSALSQIELATEETVTNVMKHAFDEEESDSFTIACERLPRGIRIAIQEKGIPFDPGKAPVYRPAGDVEEADAAGLGMFLIRSLMDDVSFVNHGPGGKETVLVKYLPEGEDAPPVETPAPRRNVTPEIIKEKLDYEVRLMQEHEAIEVSRCAFKSHGYSFFDDHIYSPEKLVELNRSGEMISAVAVTKDGQFMGHAALLYQDPADPIAELTFVFVNVEYRGQGIFNRMVEFLFSLPKPRRMDGIYAYAVANHVFTQKAMARYGINECGILVATSPASWKFKGIPGDPNQRISVIMSFKYLEPPAPRPVYLPPQHQEIITRLYRNIGVEPQVTVPENYALAGLEGESEIEISENESEGCTGLFINRYGADPVRDIRRLTRACCLKGIAAINVFLPLENPATYLIAGEAESFGYFFAGILPGSRQGDALILQYLNNVDLHYDKIAAHSEAARELLAYIRARDPNENL